jgi:hypothetical protein
MRVRSIVIAVMLTSSLGPGAKVSAETIELNGLPCNELCQRWMGVQPPAPEPPFAQPLKTQDRQIAPKVRKKRSPDQHVTTHLPNNRAPHPGDRTDTLSGEKNRPSVAPSGQPSSDFLASPDPVGDSAIQPANLPPLKQPLSAARQLAGPAAVGDQEGATLAPIDTSAVPAQDSVLILLAKPEIEDLDSLGDVPVLLAGPFGVSDAQIIAALSAGHTKPVTLVHGSKEDIDRLIGGEVKVVVAAVVSQAEAKDFPSLSTLRVFRVPFSSR